jgi:hypothetical protein
MSRYAKANQTIEDLKALIEEKSDPSYGGPYGILNGESPARSIICKDLSKIDVDFENVEYCGTEDSFETPGAEDLETFEMIGSDASAFPVAWCACGGDWEVPLIFVLYIGAKGELRGYIPKDGNVYNHKEKCAYGSDLECLDDEDEIDMDDPKYTFDIDMLRADVMQRIQIQP